MAFQTQIESIRSLAGEVLGDFRRLLVPLAWFELVFKSGVAILSIAGGAGLLAVLAKSTGTSAVTNTDIVEFLLSPVGVLVAAVLVLSALLFIILEHLGVMAIVARFQRGQKISTMGISGSLASLLIPLLKLKAQGLAFLGLTAAPLALLAWLTYAALLTHHDINFYLADRPPSFLAAVSIGVVLAASFLGIFAYLYVRTIFLFPIILHEDLPARPSLSESLKRTKGAVRRLGTVLLGWQIVAFGLSVAVLWGFAAVAGSLLHLVAHRLWAMVPLVALLLALQGIVLAVLSFVLVAVHSILILRLYQERNTSLGLLSPTPPPPSSLQRHLEVPGIRSLLRYWKIGVLAFLAVYVGFCVSVLEQFGTPGKVIVTAHKGFSRAAPENSLSAVRKAIEVGADFAEIDVQATSDGEVILNHDRDFMRVAGVSREVRKMTLAEVRAVDIGSGFSPEFAGERVPTLKEVIALARDKIKVQIELKFYDKDRTLARKVARLIEDEQFESQCVVSSLHYDGLLEAHRVNPRLRTAAIVTFSIGDIDRLKVDGVSVNARHLSNRLIRATRSHHKDLYAWTVDDPRAMLTLMERGVPNIVTNRPDLLVRLRSEFAGLSDIERRLLAARYLLGLEPQVLRNFESPRALDPQEEEQP
jgi:glycerophosphoryl diester phosphodiesterase